MIYFFVEVLEARTWFLSVWPSICEALKQNAGDSVKIFFIDGHPKTERVVRRLARSDELQIERLSFDACEIFDDEQTLVWLRLFYRDMNETLRSITSDTNFKSFLADFNNSNDLKVYIKKQALSDVPIYAGSGPWRAMFLFQVALWKSRNDGVADDRVTLFLKRIPWIDAMGQYFRTHGGLSVVAGGSQTLPWRTLRILLGPDTRVLSEKLRRVLISKGKINKSEVSKPSLALQYSGHFNVDHPQYYSDFFFWQQSDFPGSRLVAMFGIPIDPLDEGRYTALLRHGIRSLALRHDVQICSKADVHADTAFWSNFGSALKILKNTFHSPDAAWLDNQRMLFQSQKNYWKRLFKKKNVKIFTGWYKYDGAHCVIGEALRELDGVLAIYQRSYEGNPTVLTALQADVYFGFSSQGAKGEAEIGSSIGCYVVTGYLGDHRFPLLREEAEKVRLRLQSKGARRIVAFFDEGSFPDVRWGVGVKRLQDHYKFLLEKLLSEGDLGLVIKPKTPRTLWQRLGPVGDLLRRAINTGRCHVYQEGILQGSAPPALAALSADLAIHSSLSAGTAAIEATLAGVPTVLLDYDGFTISPLYKLGLGRVVFKDFESLWRIWCDHCNGTVIDPGFADWSPVLEEIDPFRDGRAAERMGTFLKWMMDGFSDGLSRDAVIEQAAARYRQAWGSDKILEVRPAR